MLSARVVVVRSFRRSNMTHVEFWSERCYIPMPLHTSRIDHRCSDAQGLRNPESRQPRGAAAGRRRSGPTHLTPELQNGRDPARMSSQRLTRGVAPHAQTPKSRRSDSQDCEENPSLFGFLLGTRDARGSICRAQTLGGPALSPSARAGVSTLSLEVRWAVAKDISVTAMFRIHLVEKPWEKRNCTCCCDAGSETHLGQGSCAVCLHGTCGRASCRDGKLT